MKMTYDKESDALYIYLISDIDLKPGWVSKTYQCNPTEVNGLINLDFDESQRLGGIEILNASKKISKNILESAQRIDVDLL